MRRTKKQVLSELFERPFTLVLSAGFSVLLTLDSCRRSKAGLDLKRSLALTPELEWLVVSGMSADELRPSCGV